MGTPWKSPPRDLPREARCLVGLISSSVPEKGKEVGINRVGLGRRHAVRKALVSFQSAILQQLCRQGGRIGIRHDLVVIAMHHQIAVDLVLLYPALEIG